MAVTQTALAKELGVTRSAVCQAIKSGRLSRSVRTVRGRPQLISMDAAVAEWREKTGPAYGQTAPRKRTPSANETEGEADVGKLDYHELRTESERCKVRKLQAEAEAAELRSQHLRGDLVSKAEVVADVRQLFARVRTRLRGVPSRLKQEDPSVPARTLAQIAQLVDEALTELVDGDGDNDK